MSAQPENDLVEQLRKKDERLEFNKRITTISWWWFGAIIIYIALNILFPIPDAAGTPPWRGPPWTLDLRKTFGAALITFVAFTAFYDLVFRRKDARILERSIVRAVTANSDMLDKLGPELKELHLNNSLRSLLGHEIGEAMFADVVQPVIDADAGFRRYYSYHVTMLEKESYPNPSAFPTLQGVIDESRYHWIREDIQYQRFLPSKDCIFWGPFTIILVFDRVSLYNLYSDSTIYFRSLIELDENLVKAMFELDDGQIDKFIRDVIGFSCSEFSGSKRDVGYSVVADRKSGRGLIKIVTEELLDRSPLNRLKVVFCYPHQRNATHYTFAMPEPCQSFEMDFNSCGDVQGLEMTEYLSNIPRERVHVNEYRPGSSALSFRIRVDGWVFPLSGITFTWRNRNVERQIVNLTFGASKKRFYLSWSGAGSGEEQLKRALMVIERDVGPSSGNAEDFFSSAQEIFRSLGLEPFKG